MSQSEVIICLPKVSDPPTVWVRACRSPLLCSGKVEEDPWISNT